MHQLKIQTACFSFQWLSLYLMCKKTAVERGAQKVTSLQSRTVWILGWTILNKSFCYSFYKCIVCSQWDTESSTLLCSTTSTFMWIFYFISYFFFYCPCYSCGFIILFVMYMNVVCDICKLLVPWISPWGLIKYLSVYLPHLFWFQISIYRNTLFNVSDDHYTLIKEKLSQL